MSFANPKRNPSGIMGGQFKVLTTDQLQKIHFATLEVLFRTGIKFEAEEALKVLHDGGADVDYKTQIAKIPHHLVEWAIKRTPPRYKDYGRDPKNY